MDKTQTLVPRRIRRWTAIILLGGALGLAVTLLKGECAVIALSASIALVSIWWMHYLVPIFSVKQLTVAVAFYWMYFLQVYLPAHLIFLERRGPAQWRYMAAVIGVLLLVPLGITFAQIIYRRGRRDTLRFFAEATWPPKPLAGKHLWILGLLFLSLVVVALHVHQLPAIPLVALISHPGQSVMIAEVRESSVKVLPVSPWLKYLMAWTRDFFFPLLTMLCWSEYKISKKRKWLLLGAMILVFGLFYALLSVAKGPAASFLLILILFYWLWFAKRVSVQTVLIAAGVVLLLPFMINFLRYGMHLTLSDVSRTIDGLMYRLFYITSDMPYHYFDLFPINGQFLGGRSIGLLSSVMGWEYFNTSRYVFSVLMPGGLESGYANSVFIGDLYADFAMGGVLLGSCLLGFILQALQIYLERQPRTSLLLSIYAFVCVTATNLVSTSITITLMTGGILTALAILWCSRHIVPRLVLRGPLDKRRRMSNKVASSAILDRRAKL